MLHPYSLSSAATATTLLDKVVQNDLTAVKTSLDFIKNTGFTVVRTWAFMEHHDSVEDETKMMQTSIEGKYNFDRFDTMMKRWRQWGV